MTADIRAENSFHKALNFLEQNKSNNEVKDKLDKVHQWGHEWIEPRESFGNSFLKGVTGAIHKFVVAFFHTMWAMTVGKFFKDKDLNNYVVKNWKQCGKNLLVVAKSIVGIVAPSLAPKVDKLFNPIGIYSNSKPSNEDGDEKNSSKSQEIENI